MRAKPIIAITMGDPAGIGPEIILKTLAKKKIYRMCHPVVIGAASVISMTLDMLDLPDLSVHPIKLISDANFKFGSIDVLDLDNINLQRLTIGKVSPQAGKAAVEYVIKATKLAMQGKVQALVTAPLNKEAMHKAGYSYGGHTEILAELTNSSEVAMMLISGPLRVIHVSTHISLRQACDLVTKERVLKAIKIAHQTAEQMGISKPRVAVAGLNPHAGEGGIFGQEEIYEIRPAIEAAIEMGIDARGPIPPDSIFFRAMKGEFDIVVAMYHDQGHIPVKMFGFKKGVNLTLGIPVIRTSVDHGTAYDIAGKGIADPQSLQEAIKLAVQIYNKARKSD